MKEETKAKLSLIGFFVNFILVGLIMSNRPGLYDVEGKANLETGLLVATNVGDVYVTDIQKDETYKKGDSYFLEMEVVVPEIIHYSLATTWDGSSFYLVRGKDGRNTLLSPTPSSSRIGYDWRPLELTTVVNKALHEKFRSAGFIVKNISVRGS